MSLVPRSWLLALPLVVAGCSHPPAVTSNELVEPDDSQSWQERVELTPPRQWRELTPQEEEAALAAMRDFAAGRPVDAAGSTLGPAPGPRKVRWSDVESAALAALDQIEATWVRKHQDPGGDLWRFEIATVEDSPGELIVRRVQGPDIYETSASIGRFPQRPEHARRAQELLQAFDEQMEKLGAMPWFNDEDAG